MTRRMIDSSMWANEKFGILPMGAQLLQIGLINHADDQGRIKANPVYLSKTIFTYNEEVTTGDIKKWLTLLSDNGTIIHYEVDGKQYAQMINWWKYQSLQYAQPSQYPRPKGWQDRIRRTITKSMIVTCNWLKVNQEPIANTCDMDGNLLPRSTNGKPPPAPEPKPEPYFPPATPVEIPFGLPDDDEVQDADSPIDSPIDSPEYSGEVPTYSFNENLTDGGDSKTSAREAVTTHRPPPPSPKADSHKYIDPRKVVGQFVQSGKGDKPYEVFREYFPWTPNLSQIQHMHQNVTDLARWREILSGCAARGFKTYKNMFEVYVEGFRDNRAPPGQQVAVTSGRVELSVAGML